MTTKTRYNIYARWPHRTKPATFLSCAVEQNLSFNEAIRLSYWFNETTRMQKGPKVSFLSPHYYFVEENNE